MLILALVSALLLADDGPAPADARAAATAKPGPAEDLARYNELKETIPNTAAAHWKLAVWCEQNGLPGEAFAHFTAVVLRDPAREAAWRKLGYKKRGGRWVTDEQVAGEAEQKKADKAWGPKLKKIHKEVHGGKRQAEALDEVAAIEDPRAVPSVYREFGAGGATDQQIAVQILGQIGSPDASQVLAILAVYGKSPEVRRRATETLRGKHPEEYLALLVNLLADPLKYEVRPVGGPGSPGVLFVEGERFNTRRFYAPPAPNIQVMPGDVISYDDFGFPVINRPLRPLAQTPVPGSKTQANEVDLTVAFSARELMVQAQQGAMYAQLQLEQDVGQIEALNAARKTFNDLVMTVAKDATGKDLGDKPADWRKAVGGKGKYRESPREVPTIDELVPLAYMPQFGRLSFISRRVVIDS